MQACIFGFGDLDLMGVISGSSAMEFGIGSVVYFTYVDSTGGVGIWREDHTG